jgi:radical SAM superfamily enzyme YgiQ (UPF0313 family)
LKPLLLITPPFTQLNTPYPGTAYLKGFLDTKNIAAVQMDLGIEVILSIFSSKGLQLLFNKANTDNLSENTKRILSLSSEYIKTIDTVILFLQGKNPTLALQICQDNFLPEASRFQNLDQMEFAFGSMGTQDKAKHLATLYLEDISDFIVDSNFGFSRYAERLGRSANSFDELYDALMQKTSYIDNIALEILNKKIIETNPKLICFSVPFPGNLYSAFRCAQFIKQNFPNIAIEMGGGFPNTELRSLSDARVFDFFDYICLDDGELPLELINKLISKCEDQSTTKNNIDDQYKRTFILENKKVVYKNNAIQSDYKQAQVGTPNYDGLLLDQYISVIEVVNPMHSLWSDGRWNKLTMAHGCYWGKCTFCDISLDYIKIYEPIAARIIVDRMVEMSEKTGQNGFHFVDEAAPPALMREVALEILRRKKTFTWWTNIRFEKSFTADLCFLLKASGCIAVSGGLEVASDRLLKLIDKGVTVEQVAKVTRNFTESGIMVHTYLMYGYPTQTIQETIDSLEMVRQMFEMGIIQSGFWHQFAMTAHSPVGMFPEKFGVSPVKNDTFKNDEAIFAHNDIVFVDKTGIDHDKFSFGLKKSLFNFMHDIGFDFDLQQWFDFKIPKTKIASNYIENCLIDEPSFEIKPNAKVVWIGLKPIVSEFSATKKGRVFEMMLFEFHSKKFSYKIQLAKNEGLFLNYIIDLCHAENLKTTTISEIKKSFENQGLENFELFWFSKPLQVLRNNDLLLL